MNDRTAQEIMAERRQQPPAPPQWGQPSPQWAAPTPMPYYRTSGLAVASLVLSLLWLGWLGSLLGIIFGHVAHGEIRRSGGAVGGKGMATAGLVLGYLAFIGVGLLVMAAMVSAKTSTGY